MAIQTHNKIMKEAAMITKDIHTYTYVCIYIIERERESTFSHIPQMPYVIK